MNRAPVVAILLMAAAADASPLFERMRGDAATVDGGLSRGVAFADADGDGDADLLVANTINYPEFLYRNDDGRFVQVMETPPSLAGGFSEGVGWIDFDNDGDFDVVVTRVNGRNAIYRNESDWQFVEHDAGDFSRDYASSSMSCWADVDNDGWLDVFVVNRQGENDALYRNVDGKRFARVRKGPAGNNGGDGRSCAFGDMDGDGDPDLYVGNFVDPVADPVARQRNFLYVNRGEFLFEERTDGEAVTVRELTYGTSWVDVDGDADLDLFVTSIGIGDRNRLYLNDGQGNLSLHEAGFESAQGRPSKGHTWGDFDLDGDIDVAIANGTEGTPHVMNRLYLNDGSSRFHPATGDAFELDRDVSAGIAWADIDSDGDLDLYVANWGEGDQDNALYRNTATGSWLRISLVGRESNRMAVGASVTLEAGDGPGAVSMVRWLHAQTGYGSQNEPVIHFGLGEAERVNSLVVAWPSGRRETLRDMPVNRNVEITEGRASEFRVVPRSGGQAPGAGH